ncbi:MAG: hypothetical protein COU65_03905 [Candidatus Pacebacteria bacterium CG10_big_fil_rev_8_21_14_0_10_42_12]|nr:hypothetical protein [Candidatus Paceibacterota bacterium]PIR62352.1 MAG: hypothetical protein COU65_03905 [Candidatus Pacebacteria bacterium CG10_big_fil_rev_8_21_14_0_10_42_12]
MPKETSLDEKITGIEKLIDAQVILDGEIAESRLNRLIEHGDVDELLSAAERTQELRQKIRDTFVGDTAKDRKQSVSFSQLQAQLQEIINRILLGHEVRGYEEVIQEAKSIIEGKEDQLDKRELSELISMLRDIIEISKEHLSSSVKKDGVGPRGASEEISVDILPEKRKRSLESFIERVITIGDLSTVGDVEIFDLLNESLSLSSGVFQDLETANKKSSYSQVLKLITFDGHNFLDVLKMLEESVESRLVANSWFRDLEKLVEEAKTQLSEKRIAEIAEEIDNLLQSAITYFGKLTQISQGFGVIQEARLVRSRLDAIAGLKIPPGGNAELIYALSIVDQVFSPSADLRRIFLSDLLAWKQQLRSIMLSSSYGLIPGDSRLKIQQSLGKIEEAISYSETKNPMDMPWEELAAEIEYRNVDVNAHASFNLPDVKDRQVRLYQAFQARKNPKSGENSQQELERITWVNYILLTKLQDFNQNEGQMPTCTRPDLFPELQKRSIERVDLLKATTYHPIYGKLIREILKDLVQEVATPGSEISYDVVCNSGKGRTQISRYVDDNYLDEAKKLYSDLPALEATKKARFAISFATTLYYSFDLLTVSFAELQKQTKTIIHGTLKAGQKVEDIDRVITVRPDAGLVHRIERYDTFSDWSGAWLPVMESIPSDHGKKGLAKHRKALLDLREEQLLMFNCFSDSTLFSGENGIQNTTLFDTLFSDMYGFLHLSEEFMGKREMLEIDGSIYGVVDGEYKRLGLVGQEVTIKGEKVRLRENVALRSNYLVAEGGWVDLLDQVMQSLPAEVDKDMIIKGTKTKSDTGLDKGFLAKFFSNAGRAKVFPGNQMRRALAPLLTQYIIRMFMHLSATGKYREAVHKEVVEKLEGVIDDGGLEAYHVEIHKVIKAIGKEKMSDSLLPSADRKRRDRYNYVAFQWKKEGKKVPAYASSIFVRAWGKVDGISAHDATEFWDAVDGRSPMPSLTTVRSFSLVQVDNQHK